MSISSNIAPVQGSSWIFSPTNSRNDGDDGAYPTADRGATHPVATGDAEAVNDGKGVVLAGGDTQAGDFGTTVVVAAGVLQESVSTDGGDGRNTNNGGVFYEEIRGRLTWRLLLSALQHFMAAAYLASGLARGPFAPPLQDRIRQGAFVALVIGVDCLQRWGAIDGRLRNHIVTRVSGWDASSNSYPFSGPVPQGNYGSRGWFSRALTNNGGENDLGVDRTADLESNHPAGTGDTQGVNDGVGAFFAEGGPQEADAGGAFFLIEGLHGGSGVGNGGGVVYRGTNSLAASTLIIGLALLCLWMAGYLSNRVTTLVEVLVVLSLVIDYLHRLAYASHIVKAAMYSITWSVFSALIGLAVK